MSLADRLKTVTPQRSNAGCETCRYLDTLPAEDRAEFDRWLHDGNSLAQLWEVCVAEGLQISLTGFRNHIKHHQSL